MGIIPESDLFDAFIDLMGLRSRGARLRINQGDRTDLLEPLVHTINECNAGILSLATYRMHGARWVVFRVDAPYPLHVVQTLVERGVNVTHFAPLPRGRSRSRNSTECR